MNRTQIIERLRNGRPLAIEVPGSSPENRAFVFVRPKIDHERATVVSVDAFIEPYIIRKIPNEDVIREYEVTFTELKPGWKQYPDDWDRYVFASREVSFATISELEIALCNEWQHELQDLRLPHDVDHPF